MELQSNVPAHAKKQSGRHADILCEIRFHVQNNEVGRSDGAIDVGDEEITPAKCFSNKFQKKAGLREGSGLIVSFEELPMMVPRGKYTMDMYEEYMKFHGRTYDYKVMY